MPKAKKSTAKKSPVPDAKKIAANEKTFTTANFKSGWEKFTNPPEYEDYETPVFTEYANKFLPIELDAIFKESKQYLDFLDGQMGDDVELILQLTNHQSDFETKLEFMRITSHIFGDVKNAKGESPLVDFYVDYAELLWNISTVISEFDGSPAEKNRLFAKQFSKQDFNFPIVLAAMIASWHLDSNSINQVLRQYIELRNAAQGMNWKSGKGSKAKHPFGPLMPLIAMCVINPQADLNLVEEVVTKTSETNSVQSFWGYLMCAIQPNEEAGWALDEYWMYGFFANGIDVDNYEVDPKKLQLLAQLHFKNRGHWVKEDASASFDNAVVDEIFKIFL